MDNNHSRLARALGEFTVPSGSGSAVYQASSWTRLAKRREFSTFTTRPDKTTVELASASMSGSEVTVPTTSDPELGD